MRKIPMRQIHLDFHTTATIPGIGKDFDPDEFAKTLKDAKVEWINIFGKCHHGMFYYNTKIGTRHPYMEGELTAGQVEALRKYGIKFGMYTCVGWNEEWCDRHPEWMEVNPAGVLGNKTPFRAMWRKLCLNHQAYTDMIKAEIQEEFDLFRPDGYWIDIIFQNECVCGVCKTEMLRQGLDPENTLHRRRHDREVVLRFQRDVYAFTHALDPELNIYFNGHPYEMDTADEPDIAGRNKQELSDCIDIESLPSQQWGYSHFPVAINYINKYPREITMMNGRFHTVWGDFGSLRNTRALEYESFRALANGAGVCVGDQLHPSGKLDPTIYRRIGGVFAQVEAREPWCADSVKVAQGAVYAVKPVIATDEEEAKAQLAVEGAYRILTELGYTFDFVDFTEDIGGYEFVILPDFVKLNDAAERKIREYIAAGGKVIASGASAVRDGEFIPEFGLKYRGKAEYCPRYMRIGENFPTIQPMDYVVYSQSEDAAAEGAEVLSYAVNSYFNRAYNHFCSHQQTPPDGALTDSAAITKNNNCVYVASPIFSEYANHRVMLMRDIIKSLLGKLGVRPKVEADLPYFDEVTVRKLGDTLVIHVLNYIIEHKSHTLDTIEEMIPLYNRPMSVVLDAKPKSIKRWNGGELPFEWDGERASFVIPEILGHEMILIN